MIGHDLACPGQVEATGQGLDLALAVDVGDG